MSRWFILAFILVAAVALGLRLPQLDRRPMHTDESVQAWKFQELLEKGVYRYDPNEYHGPILNYATLPSAWLSAARTFPQITETTLRVVPVVFALLTILLLWLVRDAFGAGGTLWAALLTALSPGMVFYSRYYIHETLLVCFTFLVLASGWRYTRSRTLGWALMVGAGIGLMYATKETFVFPLGAMVAAIALTLWWSRWMDRRSIPIKPFLHPGHWLAAIGLALVVSFTLFSSFFTNFNGPIDSLRAYLPWLGRAGGNTQHTHPWHYYLGFLAYTHRARGPIFSEAAIMALALVAMAVALLRRQPASYREAGGVITNPPAPSPAVGSEDSPQPVAVAGRVSTSTAHAGPNLSWLRFLTFYTVLMVVIYSVIPYKTPWCLLGFLHGLILLAGAGAMALLTCLPKAAFRAVIGIFILVAAGNLGWQAWQASFPLCADQRNPYVYAHTVEDLQNLARKVAAVAKAYPPGQPLVLKVMAKGGDFWPLPWYLRQFRNVGYYKQVPDDPRAPIVICAPSLEPVLEPSLGKDYLMVGIFGLRPAVFLELFVEKNLWAQYLKTKSRSDDDD
jgi:uncharacterized protein (TIGR03663 family)